MASLTGRRPGDVGVRGVRRARGQHVGKLHVVKQPWFGPMCRAAKAAWKSAVAHRAPAADIAAARKVYMRTLRRSKVHFAWNVDRYRVHHI